MLSQKCKYAIRAVLFLSTKSENEMYGGKEISNELKIPLAFTGKILQELARNNIIASAKGPGGGFFLTTNNRCLPLIKIVEAIDGLEYFQSCGLGLPECSSAHPCPIHDTFMISRNTLLNLFQSKTIQDLTGEMELKKWVLVRE